MGNKEIWLAGLATSMGWGLTGIFVQLMPTSSALFITASRLAVALLISLPLLLLHRPSQQSLLSTVRYLAAFPLAAMLVGYYLLATTAFQLSSVPEVALLLSTPPLFILLFRSFTTKRPRLAELTGAAMSISGMLIIMLPKLTNNQTDSEWQLIGNVCALGASMLTAGYALLFKHLVSVRQLFIYPLGVSLLTFMLGGMSLGLMVIVSAAVPDWARFTLDDWAVTLALGFISTALPTLGYAFVSNNAPALITSLISLLIPVFAGVFAYLLFAQLLEWPFYLGSLLIIGAVVTIVRQANK